LALIKLISVIVLRTAFIISWEIWALSPIVISAV
jgi:hypothetical protein